MTPSLRILAKHCNLTIGAAAARENAFLNHADYRQLHADTFNLLVPVSGMKCRRVCAQPNQYDFSHADFLVDFATQHQPASTSQQAVRGHTLCWHQSYAPWMKNLTSLELEKMLLDYIITLVERDRGKVYAYKEPLPCHRPARARSAARALRFVNRSGSVLYVWGGRLGEASTASSSICCSIAFAVGPRSKPTVS